MDKSGSILVTVPPAYNGRVSGSSGVTSGLGIFTLQSKRAMKDFMAA